MTIEIEGPLSAKSGEEVSWVVKVKNLANVRIEDVSLTFEFPSGTFDKKGNLKKREKKEIKSLLPGEEKVRDFSGILFGKKEEIKKAKVSLVYHPAGISTEFEKEATFSTRISETSLVFLMKIIPEKVNPGDKISISLSWQSGFPFVLENLQVRFYYPSGFVPFSLLKEGIKEEGDELIFNLGSLNENEGGKREIKGRLDGKMGEEKLFRAEIGIFDETLYTFIPLVSQEKKIKLFGVSLDFSLRVNGEENYVPSPGEELAYIIDFFNTGGNIYRNLEIEVELKGKAFDFSTLSAPGGEILGKKIIFSFKNFPELLYLGPYERGRVGFRIKLKDYSFKFWLKNQILKEKIKLGSIEKEFERKISSKVEFSEKIYYNLPDFFKDKFQTEGVYPLEKDKETSLLVVFETKNLGNELSEVKMETTLGKEVEFLNEVFPKEGFSFNEEEKKLTFTKKLLYPRSEPYQFAFLVKVKPSSLPCQIIGKTKFSAKDVWTAKTYQFEVEPKLSEEIY